MVKLSVNVNKVATLRNARGGSQPDLVAAVEVCLRAGAPGITVHPRADQRHITAADVREVAQVLARRDGVEYNIEGDPRPDWIDTVLEVKPHQATLVPVRPGEVTSEAGWPTSTPGDELKRVIGEIQRAGIRVSVFVEANPESVQWAKQVGADRVELYTEPYARAHEAGKARQSFSRYVETARLAHDLGMGVNAGHDLDLDNLRLFRTLPHLDELSIGHALMSRALFVGLNHVVGEYLRLLAGED